MRRRVVGVVTGAIAAAFASGAAGAASPPASTVNCPIAVKGRAAVVNWAFSASPPGFYIHGRGTFTPSKATGTVCEQSSSTSRASTQLVLKVGGHGSVARGITKGGVLGAQLILPLTVTASDATGCASGTHGVLTLFTSYNAVHRDTAKLHLGGGCASFGRSFSGNTVHVAIPH